MSFSSSSSSSGSLNHEVSPTAKDRPHAQSVAVPSLVSLPDGRLALVQADVLGQTLEQRLAKKGRDFPVAFTAQSQLRTTETQQQQQAAAQNHNSSGGSSSSSSLGSNERRSAVHVRSMSLLPPDRFAVELRGILDAVISTALSLQRLHAAAIVHKAMRPSNIVLPLAPAPVALEGTEWSAPSAAAFTDLSSASLLANDKPKSDLSPHSDPLSSWLYKAPEQSGRTSSTIDNRTDLYTLGILMSVTQTRRSQCHGSMAENGQHCATVLLSHSFSRCVCLSAIAGTS